MSGHDVFISYSSKDKTTADAICALLERDGVKCWIAPRDILPGEAWEPSIVRAISVAKVFVLLYSGASNESAQVRREVARAASDELPIIPFRIANVPPNETFEYDISSQHWLDALDPPLQRHIERLSSVLRRLLGRDEETNTSGNVDPGTTPRRLSTAAGATEGTSRAHYTAPAGPLKRPIRPPALLAGAGVLLALLVAAAVFLHPSRPTATSNAPVRTSADQSAPQGAYVLAFTLTGHTDEVRSVAFSPDDKRIVSGAGDKTLRIWDAATGQPIGAPLTGHTNWVNSVAFSSDGKRIVSGAGDKTLRIWDAAAGLEIGPPLTGHTDRVFAVAFSPDGKRIVSGSADRTIRIWDATTYQEIGPPLTGHTGVVLSVAYSPDGRRIVSGSQDKTIRIWDAATGEEIGPPNKASPEQVLSVAFSPDGRRIVSGSLDNTIRIWDAATGQEIGEPLSGHTSDVNSVAFSPDGRRIASGSNDTTVRVWDAATYQQIGPPLTGHRSPVNAVAWSPDGRLIAGASADKTVGVWKVSGP